LSKNNVWMVTVS